jgi:tagatose 1,6-diphosphate aldolase
MLTFAKPFRFLDPGPLVDGELELVTPDERWIDDLLDALNDPLTRELSPRESTLTRDQLSRFIMDNPMGRQAADPEKGLVPAYHFWMRLAPEADAGVRIAGGINLRIGRTTNLELYLGHIGYNVFPPARGRHYARRAVRMLLPLARRHALSPLWITCNPDNVASRRTCEGAGGVLVETVPLPADHFLYARGERAKCRYRFDV